jgi:transcriptional regulator with XRE-family HTH domain
MNLAEYLKQKRTEANLSQAEIAKKLGYSSAQFISNWERGKSAPPLRNLAALAELLGVRSDDLFAVFLKTSLQEVSDDLKAKYKNLKE